MISVEEALKRLDDNLVGFRPEAEEVDITEAFGRVLARDVSARDDVPGFEKSTVDGYAVRAMDTYGASEAMPAMFEYTGEVLMGNPPDHGVKLGQAMWVPTGGMMPEGADSVVMVEYTDLLDETTVNVYKPVSPYENVVRRGDDIKKGSIVVKAGRRLRAQDIGALAGVGLTRVPVAKKPKVAIISTGDEIIPPDGELKPGCIRDTNSYTLSALVGQAGGDPVRYGIVKDSYNALKAAIDEVLTTADMVLVSGGSSVGHRDVTARVIADVGSPGVIAHGVSVKPGKPVVIGVANGKPVLGMPGHPVSAMIIFYLVAEKLIERKLGLIQRMACRFTGVKALMARNVASAPGREDYIRVVLRLTDGKLVAEPVLGKSALISTMVNADGLVRVPSDKEGILQGEIVQVQLF